MLRFVAMGKQSKKNEPDETEVDSGLLRVIHTIINDFNGDTSAFFDSIRPDLKRQEKERENEEKKNKMSIFTYRRHWQQQRHLHPHHH